MRPGLFDDEEFGLIADIVEDLGSGKGELVAPWDFSLALVDDEDAWWFATDVVMAPLSLLLALAAPVDFPSEEETLVVRFVSLSFCVLAF